MHPSGDFDQLKLILSIWAGLGPIIGLVVGHYLKSSWEDKRWTLDARKAEFRELVSALSNVGVLMCSPVEDKITLGPKWLEAEQNALRTIIDRIYIYKEVRELKVYERFLEARNEAGNARQAKSVADQLDRLIADLVAIAQTSRN